MHATENRLILAEPQAPHEGGETFEKPHFCFVNGHPTLVPEANVDFSGRFTWIWEMFDIPPEKSEKMARKFYGYRREKISWPEYKATFEEFTRKGGKYLKAWIVMSPDKVGWDDDAEEDFWILPVPCEEPGRKETKP